MCLQRPFTNIRTCQPAQYAVIKSSMSYHANHTGSDNKDPDNDARFYLSICAVLSGSSLFVRIINEDFFFFFFFFFFFLPLNMLLLSKIRAFRMGF